MAIVPPVTSTPLKSSGSSNSSRSQSVAITSRRVPRGEAIQAATFWSSADVSQSAASAAGVVPPITKWKKRGPLERVAVAAPSLREVAHRGEGAVAVVRQAPRDLLDRRLGPLRLDRIAREALQIAPRFTGGQLEGRVQVAASAERIAHTAAASSSRSRRRSSSSERTSIRTNTATSTITNVSDCSSIIIAPPTFWSSTADRPQIRGTLS